MKIKVVSSTLLVAFAVAAIAIDPLPAVAQRGAGGHAFTSAPAPKAVAKNASRTATGRTAPFGNGASQQRAPRFSLRVNGKAVVGKTQNPVATQTSTTVVTNYVTNYQYRGGWSGTWWGPSYAGWWFGYGPYLGYWPYYGNAYWAMQEPRYTADKKTGIKLDLAKDIEKEARKELEKGMVEISEDDGKTWNGFQSVEELVKHTHHLEPGTYGVRIKLANGQAILERPILIEKGSVAHVEVAFSKTPPSAPSAPSAPVAPSAPTA